MTRPCDTVQNPTSSAVVCTPKNTALMREFVLVQYRTVTWVSDYTVNFRMMARSLPHCYCGWRRTTYHMGTPHNCRGWQNACFEGIDDDCDVPRLTRTSSKYLR